VLVPAPVLVPALALVAGASLFQNRDSWIGGSD
jgi:hypothetical protein